MQQQALPPANRASRKNLSLQQSQGQLKPSEIIQQTTSDSNPTQQILKLRAAALVPQTGISLDKPSATKTKLRGVAAAQQTTNPSTLKKQQIRQNQQKLAQMLGEQSQQQLTAQMIQNLHTISNDVNSRQQVHEHNIDKIPVLKNTAAHQKAFSMSTYQLSKQHPKTFQMGTNEGFSAQEVPQKKAQQTIGTHQKSQSTFHGQFPTNFDVARKTFHNGAPTQTKVITNESLGSLITHKKAVAKKPETVYQPQSNVNSVHRRVLSHQMQQSADAQLPPNLDHYLNSGDGQPILTAGGKIVVINNNNNTNINIHHQGGYPVDSAQYLQAATKQGTHKKNVQSFHIPT